MLTYALSACAWSVQSAGIAADGIAFAFGLATTLALLGVVASLAGKAYGQVTPGFAATAP